MLIICPSCETSYEVSVASLGAEGRSVRCVRCRQTWFAAPPPEAGDAVSAINAAAASARYQQGAASSAEEAAAGGSPAGDTIDQDPDSVDPNLAARAADHAAATFDDPPPLEGESAAALLAAAFAAAASAEDAPSLAPAGDEAASAAEPGAKNPHDIESMAARRARRQKYNPPPREIRLGISLLIAVLLIADGAILGWRSTIVRAMPQTASLFRAIGLPVNLRGLDFSDVKTANEVSKGVGVLMVDGTIINVSGQMHEVPRIRFAVRNTAGTEVYTWTTLPERPTLAPGESEPFQTRLASPPGDGHDVVVRFFTRRDIAAGRR